MQLHPTSLTSFMCCPYKYRYDKSDILVKNVMPGDILNIAVCSDGDTKPFLDYYLENYDGDFKQSEMLRKIYENVRRDKDNIRQDVIDKHASRWDVAFPKPVPFYQESKFYLHVSDDVDIVGTPDCVYYDYDEQLWTIIDWKTSKNFDRYKGNAIREESFQTIVYAKFVMTYMKVDKIKFQFYVYNKNNGEKLIVERPEELGWVYFTLAEVDARLTEAINKYQESDLLDERSPKSCRYCMFCGEKKTTCPLFNKKITQTEEL